MQMKERGADMIKLLVDSTCDFPERFLKEHRIDWLPLRVRLEDKEYADQEEIEVQEVYDAMKQGVMPQTSQPLPGDIIKKLEACGENKDDVIYISFSGKMSGTYQTVHILMEEMSTRYPECRFTAVDSKSGSICIGFMAMEATRLRDEGATYDEILARIRFLADHAEHIFTLTDLNWLVKGGRISKAEGILGNMLNIKPLIHVNDGFIEVYEKVRGQKKLLTKLVDTVEERISDYKQQTIGLVHAEETELLHTIREMLKERLGDVQFVETGIGSVLSAHLGLSGIGICFFNKY